MNEEKERHAGSCPPTRVMQITITSGTGSGPTPLAAFDAALLNSGVANYNLICLSSVIPPGAIIQLAPFVAPAEDFGNRLYVVMARHGECQPGHAACAGLGWAQNGVSGQGLFVEEYGASKGAVETQIHATMEAMVASRPSSFGPVHMELAHIGCLDRPVCAVVIAVYKSQGWDR